jgi:Family of unknown function (DUF6361)
MPSMIAWLDASREDQRRMREIVNLFTQSESRDELGIGQVRDAFSDSLFPGTSTLHTRARYLLFVPWCFVAAAAKGGIAARGERRVEDNERALIAGLTDLGATDGLIGRLAGVAVKTLPSTVYWGALRQYGIVQVTEPLDALGFPVTSDPDQEELAERVIGAWSPTLPPIPPGFPRHPETGFELSRAEARWLQERMLGGTEGSLLHHLASDGNRPQPNSNAPWDDPICRTPVPEVKGILEHARLFSLAVHGASFLYNLMVAERYVAAGHTKIEKPVERYRDRLQEWAQECEENDMQLAAWDRGAFWDVILAVNPQVRPGTRRFLGTWFDRVCSLDLRHAADDDALRELIDRRERAQKGSQSRLTNDRLLAAWSGQSGTRRLTYRWDQANRIIQDLHDGLEAASAAT